MGRHDRGTEWELYKRQGHGGVREEVTPLQEEFARQSACWGVGKTAAPDRRRFTTGIWC